MEGAIKILKRFIGSTIFIVIFILLLNFFLLFIWLSKGMNSGHSPSVVVEEISKDIYKANNDFYLSTPSKELLDKNSAWAMLLNNSGEILWSYALPTETIKNYSITDVAKFSRGYLMDYPVFVWENNYGLMVVGYPKDTIAKYQHVLPFNWIKDLPFRILLLIMGNIFLILILSLLIGSKLITSIRPLTKAIKSLEEDKNVFIEPKGVLSNLAESINHASSLLSDKNSALKSRDEARSNWIAGISHDIRTPLSIILGYANDLEENYNISSEQRLQAGIIRKQAEKLGVLVSDLNLVSMLEYEMQPLNKKIVRLSSLVRYVVSDFLNNDLNEKFILEIDELDDKSTINGDERLLIRAITNLIQNSIHHNEDGCHIHLKVSCDSICNIASLSIYDNGKGVNRDSLNDLLELPFSSKRKHQIHNGHGLGLPMVSRIIKAHDGILILSSDIGEGFYSKIELPLINSYSGNLQER